MSVQSLMTPAMFIVSALVLPMSIKTARFSARAVAALAAKTLGRSVQEGSRRRRRTPGSSAVTKGKARQRRQAGET